MEDGLLSLKWNNHKTTFFDILRVLREKANYTDATIAVEGKFYPVHKLVMSTCSEYFSEIFERTPCKSPVIVLKDVRSQDMDALLDYMYLGEVNVNQNDLASLLKTAECLRIKGLAVPDEDPHKTKKQLLPDDRRESPPPKRRRHEDPSSTSQTLRPTSPPRPPAPPKTRPRRERLETGRGRNARPPYRAHRAKTPPMTHPLTLRPWLRWRWRRRRTWRTATGGTTAMRVGPSTRGTEGTTARRSPNPSIDPENYGGGSYAGPSLQQGGDLPWEEGDSSSFPPEGFSGDHPGGQQPQGDDDDDDGDGPLTVAAPHSSPNGPPLLTPISQARQCQLCLVTLANANLLRRHVEDHHFHIRKYDCAHCGKKFKRKEHKERHERIHTGEKPFACYICNARFTQKEHLKGHIENVHHKHGEKGLEGMGDLEDREDKDEEDMDLPPASSSSPPPPNTTSASSPSLAPVSSLISLASTASPLASILPPSTLLANTAAATSLTSSSSSSSPALIPASDLNMNQFTALYAPVTRKTVNSPNKHMQTITINFN
ncbi:LOW QUALITY PROTEIN: longitudinals lacking protein, isoforms J/P/Q/S/Z-like [Scylla paramamosain]|uniref:LOW QUALITY PROTEIN: longitudinals lacking protein, isoforms J/P/Q/S/Z-like n=1 Tax=Scylla paramamosain TaxID=85552 RepID=UPI0030836E09